ncbi:3-isopropylmalate dehydratase large subunit [Pelagibius marinus]|uniref:3-isopropylmalate dehydratase large subunit n=1 Tax=Pelagibius marinus TaxID=2762760 RepID=UPI0018725357|nr:aconitase family protein [Pelagibius marinus]
MGKTAVEKILSRIEGRPVKRGELIFPVAELVTVHDWYVCNMSQTLAEFGVTSLYDPRRIAFFTDHEPIAVSPQAALRQKATREIARRFEVEHFFDVGRGGNGHIFGVEIGLARPGMFASGYDTHVTSYGAIGCFATAIVTEVAELAACGSVWLEVPRSVRIDLTGDLAKGVYARDVAQYLISAYDAEIFDDAVVEFSGPALKRFSIDDRFVLVNTPMEVGARTGFISPDDICLAHCALRGIDISLAQSSDDDADWAEVIELDLGGIEPQVAKPPRPDLSVPLSDVKGTRFQHAFIGSCAAGMLSDMRTAARILEGRQVHSDVRLFVTPATQQIAVQAAREGLMEIFAEAGAVVTAPGCGACAGGRIGPTAEGEVSLNTGTRNDFGRLGSTDARIYIASSATVAASCISGAISDPREFLTEVANV